MKKQKICIIGDGLSGLTTALAVKSPYLDVDLYYEKNKPKKIDKRITAISDSNFIFLKSLLNSNSKRLFWTCKKIDLFYENKQQYLNFLNFNGTKNALMHIFENNKIKNALLKKIRSKNIKLVSRKISKVNIKDTSITVEKNKIFYDLIIMCLGAHSNLYNEFDRSRAVKKNYNEIAITGYIKHNLKLDNPKQYFLVEGPLAFLPFKENSFSYVWSLNKDFFYHNKLNIKTIVEKRIKNLINKKSKLKLSNIQFYPINLNLPFTYYKKNTTILGEGLHSVHPIAGQGFNLVLRDISYLTNLIKKNLSLGLEIKNSTILNNFMQKRKPENIILSLGIDVTNNFFKKNKILDPLKNKFLKNISKFSSLKKISEMISNKGISI